jgi:hypothetical protein
MRHIHGDADMVEHWLRHGPRLEEATMAATLQGPRLVIVHVVPVPLWHHGRGGNHDLRRQEAITAYLGMVVGR